MVSFETHNLHYRQTYEYTDITAYKICEYYGSEKRSLNLKNRIYMSQWGISVFFLTGITQKGLYSNKYY